MGEPDVVGFAVHFATVFVPVVVWLLICKVVRGLRRRVGFAYSIAAVIAIAACLLAPEPGTPSRIAACLAVIVLLYASWKRALKVRSLEANTIISYEHENFR